MSAKWYRDTVVYHRGSYSPRPVTHCRAYVVSRYPFGSYPPRCSMARIVRHARSMPLKNRACLSGNCWRLRDENVQDERRSPFCENHFGEFLAASQPIVGEYYNGKLFYTIILIIFYYHSMSLILRNEFNIYKIAQQNTISLHFKNFLFLFYDMVFLKLL